MKQIDRTKVSELMRKDVITLAPEDTIERALELFEEQRIGGAPVADDSGNLVGVLTLSDVTRTERLSDGGVSLRHRSYEMSEPVGDERIDELDPDELFFVKSDYSEQLWGRDLVGDWMTQEVIAVTPDTTLAEACQIMVDAHIHRVFVADQEKLCGVISSFDVVRHMARTEPAQASPKVAVALKAAAAPKAAATHKATATPKAAAAHKRAAHHPAKATHPSTSPQRVR